MVAAVALTRFVLERFFGIFIIVEFERVTLEPARAVPVFWLAIPTALLALTLLYLWAGKRK